MVLRNMETVLPLGGISVDLVSVSALGLLPIYQNSFNA